MGNRICTLIAVALSSVAPVMAASGTPGTTGASTPPVGPSASALRHTPPVPGDWIVEEVDNVCGLKDARQLRNPAVVDYEALIAVTAEVREMKRRGIDKDSPEGQVLFNKAVDRVRTAASDHMKSSGYDSIWKDIKHRRGQKAPDVTDDVKKLVEKSSKGAVPAR